MISEQQASKELMDRNWSFSIFKELDMIHGALKELGVPPGQALQLIKATTELKDADFRAAAFSLLELKKTMGKSYKEADAYTQGLKAQITSKEKLNSSWLNKIEQAKGELKGWEQKVTEETARFESERAQNKRILAEDGEKLKLELKQSNEIRANIQETIGIKADLKKVGLDLPTFKSIVTETVLKGGIGPHIAKDIKAAVGTFTSLGKAITERAREEKAKKEAILNLSREEKEKREAFSREERERKELLRVLDKSIALKREKSTELSKHLDLSNKLLLDWDEEIEKKKWQFEFFQMFISMLLASPSAPDSLTTIALKLQELEQKGWTHYGEPTLPEQRRGVFISLVMGTYLHSVHCNNCGASFIVNKAYTAYNQFKSHYNCPVCPNSWDVKLDKTFLNLMLSPELAKKLQDARTLLDRIEKSDFRDLLTKLKFLDSVPTEVYVAFSEGRKIEVKIPNGTD